MEWLLSLADAVIHLSQDNHTTEFPTQNDFHSPETKCYAHWRILQCTDTTALQTLQNAPVIIANLPALPPRQLLETSSTTPVYDLLDQYINLPPQD